MVFHEEERSTTALLEAYEDSRPGAVVVMKFAEGDVYKCQFYTAYESDNCLDLDDPNYDEFFELVYKVLETVTLGKNCYEEHSEKWVTLNYKHFPVLVTSENGTVIYCC